MSTPTTSPTPTVHPHPNCPQCGRPIPPDAALNLCPACLLAAALPTQAAAHAHPKSPPPLPSPEELATEFPQLDILAHLGRGGMGAVYRARQRNLDRIVALKILRPGLDADPTFADRFHHEARALAQLNHPGIVTLYETGRTPGGLYYILMEYVDGLTLRQLLDDAHGPMPAREALEIVPQICDALQYAHDHGIVHRDIKPENVLLNKQGRVKVADFGLAQIATPRGAGVPPAVGASLATPAPAGQIYRIPEEHLQAQTQSRASQAKPLQRSRVPLPPLPPLPPPPPPTKIMGTPAYMAPEQTTAPATVDHRADIYALGVVLYQMLTGELPTPAQTLIPPSRKIHIDVRLDEIVLRALEQNPARRYDQASDLKTHVELLTQASTSPLPPPLPTADNPHDHPTHTTTPPRSRIPRHPLIAPFIAILISTVVFLAILIWASGQLPERVASHFNFSGRADGWLSRTTFLLLLEFSGLGTSFVMGALFLAIHHVSLRFVNLPFISPGNRRYWMAPERLSATLAFVRVRGLWIIPGLLGFFAALVVIIVYANRLTPPRLPLYWLAAPTLLLLGTMFFAFTLPFITRKTRGLPLPAPHRPFPPPLSFVLILAGLLLPTLASLWLTQEKSPGFIHPQTAALIATHNDTVRDAQTWLALIDDGHYKQSRDEAASVFRSKVNLESWTLALQQHRQPLGAVVNRRIFSAENENPNTKTPLLVMQFATEFSRKKSAIETVTFSREPDGVWRASGYYIK